MLAIIGALFGIALTLTPNFPKTAPSFVLFLVVLLGYYYRDTLARPIRAGWYGLAAASAVLYVYYMVAIVRERILEPPYYDFSLYWIYAQVAVRGQNFYDANNAVAFLQSLTLPVEAYADRFFDLYFQYPPPSMFFFLPLGHFGLHSGAVLWYSMLAIGLVVDIGLLSTILLERRDIETFLVVTILVLGLGSTYESFGLGQANCIALLTLLMLWRHRESWWGGAWLTVGILIRPVLALLPLYLILERYWRALIGAVVAALLLSALAIARFGTSVFVAYLASFQLVSTGHYPNKWFAEDQNASLLGTIVKFMHDVPTQHAAFLNPMYLVIAGLIFVITFLVVVALDKSEYSGLAFVLTVPAMLMIYPPTGFGSTLLCAVPMAWLLRNRAQFPGGPLGAMVIVSIAFAASRTTGTHYFFATAVLWSALLVMARKALATKPHAIGIPGQRLTSLFGIK